MKRTFAFELRCLPLLGMLVGVLFAGTSGCAGDLDPSLIPGTAGTQGQSGTSGGAGTMGTAGTGGGGTACDAPTMVFKSTASGISCTTCHSKTGAATLGAGLDLESAGVGARLLGKGPVKDTTGGAACMAQTKPYLVPNSNPPDGLLFDKTDATKFAALNCGSQMPIGGMLTPAQQTCLSSWAAGVIAGTVQ